MVNRVTSLAWEYHDATKHSHWSVRANPHYLDWDNQPSPFKVYPELEVLSLPRELLKTDVPALAAIASQATGASGEVALSLDQLASLLYFSAGVTRKKSNPEREIFFRAAACAGALYPTEVYVVASDIQGLGAGVYHFNPGDFALRRLREGDFRGSLVRATARESSVAVAPVILVFTSMSWRSSWKYRARAYRYHFWDNGTILANALALAAAHRLPARVVMGFVEEDVNRLIGVDGKHEVVLSLLTLGHSVDAPIEEAPADELPELELDVLPLSPEQVDYPLIYEMHAASSLTSGAEVAEWRRAAIDSPRPEAPGVMIPLSPAPPDQLPHESIEEVIQRRASTRRFARKAISYAELSTVLDRATRSIPADYLDGQAAQLNDIYLIVNRVDGLAAGAYFYRRDESSLELLKEGDFSDEAAYLTLEQDLGGAASVTLFFLADLNNVFDHLGNRGYRAAQMEAGIIGGKAYLAAYALKRGATGLTFYDDDVTEFFSPHAAGKSCMFVTSLGVPGKRPLL
jgi:SagB-type dehydrogenase family enzyme